MSNNAGLAKVISAMGTFFVLSSRFGLKPKDYLFGMATGMIAGNALACYGDVNMIEMIHQIGNNDKAVQQQLGNNSTVAASAVNVGQKAE